MDTWSLPGPYNGGDLFDEAHILQKSGSNKEFTKCKDFTGPFAVEGSC